MTQSVSDSIRYTGRALPFHRDLGLRPMLLPLAMVLLTLAMFGLLLVLAEDQQQVLTEIGLPLLGLLFLTLGLGFGMTYIARNVSLTLDDSGIHFSNALPMASMLKPSWFLPWSEIKQVEYKGNLKSGNKNPWLRQVRLHSRSGRVYKLDPVQWVDSDPGRPDFGMRMKDVFSNLHKGGAQMARQKIALHSHLVEDLGERGWPALDPEAQAAEARPGYTDRGQFDLMQHRGLASLTIAALALLGYFVIDTYFTSPWRYAENAPLPAFALTGLVLATAAAGLGRGAPRLERLGVTLMFGLAVGAACWPAALRLNAAFSNQEAVTITYYSVAPGEFEPVAGDYPPLDFTGFEDYWFHPDQRGRYDFELLRGPLEFWQLNRRRVTGEMRAFFTANGKRAEP